MMKLLFLFLIASVFIFSQQIALTFDDAPRGDGNYFSGKERTGRLIEKLKKFNVQAAFFCTTNGFHEEGKERINKYSGAGHIIANHSHLHRSLNRVAVEDYIEDMQLADSQIKDFQNYKRWFRFPYLHEGNTVEKRDAVRKFFKENDYINGYVTVDNYDWYMESIFQKSLKEKKEIDIDKFKAAYVDLLFDAVLFYDNIAKEALGRSPKHVLLLHENDIAALFIDSLIEKLQSEGWKIISPGEAYTDEIALHEPDVLLNNQGRVAAIAKEKGYEGALVHPAEDEKYLEEYFKENGIVK